MEIFSRTSARLAILPAYFSVSADTFPLLQNSPVNKLHQVDFLNAETLPLTAQVGVLSGSSLFNTGDSVGVPSRAYIPVTTQKQ